MYIVVHTVDGYIHTSDELEYDKKDIRDAAKTVVSILRTVRDQDSRIFFKADNGSSIVSIPCSKVTSVSVNGLSDAEKQALETVS